MGRKKRRHENERTATEDLPNIDKIYIQKGKLLRSLEDPNKFIRKGFQEVGWKRGGIHQHVANSDASVEVKKDERTGKNYYTGRYSHGYVIRDHEGEMKKVGRGRGIREDMKHGGLVSVAEMLGIEDLLKDIDPQRYPHLIISCDNEGVMHLLSTMETENAELMEIMIRIIELISEKYPPASADRSLSFEPVLREGNFLADWWSHLGERLEQEGSEHYEKGQKKFDEVCSDSTTQYFAWRDVHGPNYIRDVIKKKKNNATNKSQKKAASGEAGEVVGGVFRTSSKKI